MKRVRNIKKILNFMKKNEIHIPAECESLVNAIEKAVSGAIRPANLKVLCDKTYKRFGGWYQISEGELGCLDINIIRRLNANDNVMWVLTHITEMETEHAIILLQNAREMFSASRL